MQTRVIVRCTAVKRVEVEDRFTGRTVELATFTTFNRNAVRSSNAEPFEVEVTGHGQNFQPGAEYHVTFAPVHPMT